MAVFNANNKAHITKEHRLFLGEPLALHDSINVHYPEIQKLYKRQVSSRWVETEFNFQQSRLDLISCPKSVYDIMLLNLSYQWSADSVAARAIAPLFAPFVTSSELWNYLLEVSNMEVIHALTYSEIVRQCVPNPDEVFGMVMDNANTLNRVSNVNTVFDELAYAGAMYTLGYTTKEDAYQYVYKALCALYMLERLQFMASFAATFAIVEQGYFQGIGTAVQKIMIDEVTIHAEGDKAMLAIEHATPRGASAKANNASYVSRLLHEVVASELAWSDSLFADGRSIVGLNPLLLKEWVLYNAQVVAEELDVKLAHPWVANNPLPWMSNYIDIDKRQTAMQETVGANYSLNVLQNDVDEGEEFEF